MKRRLKIVISLGYYVCISIRRLARRFLGVGTADPLVVLLYHAVPDEARARFARQMSIVSRYAQVVAADEAPRTTEGRRAVAITFDDAFRSVAQNAVPELARRSFPATIFVPAGVMGRSPDWGFESDSMDKAESVMTQEELRQLASDLVTLGSHSTTHSRLSDLDDASLRDEVGGSRHLLEQAVGNNVTLFAFPYGAYDDRVVDACRTAGYTRVFSVDPRAAAIDGSDYVRGRIEVELSDGALEFFLKIHGAYAWMVHASALKRRFVGPSVG